MLYKEISGKILTPYLWRPPWSPGRLGVFGTRTPGTDSSTGFSFSACAQGKAHSNSLIAPSGISGQGKVWWDSYTQNCAPDSANLCATCSGHSRHSILCLVSSTFTLTFFLFLHPPFFWSFFPLHNPSQSPHPLSVCQPYFPDTGDGNSVNQLSNSVSDTFSSPLWLDRSLIVHLMLRSICSSWWIF